jgi:hypothetical protein
MAHKFISTVAGRAKLYKIETEDALGRWNQSWRTSDGFWVVHVGKKHYVYKVV